MSPFFWGFILGAAIVGLIWAIGKAAKAWANRQILGSKDNAPVDEPVDRNGGTV